MGVAKGDDVLIFVRPENIKVFKERPGSGSNAFAGEIISVTFLGEFADCQLRVGPEVLWVRLHPLADFKEQEKIFIQIDHDASFSITAGRHSVENIT